MNPRPTALRRALAAVLGILLAGASAVLASPAATAAPLVSVELTSVTVSGPDPDDLVEVRGRVSNPTGALVYGLRMAIWRSRDPIGELATVRQVTRTSPEGVIWTAPGAIDKIAEQNEPFPAGAGSEFVVRASLADLGFDTAGVVYTVGARALGTTDGGIAFGNVGQGASVITVPGDRIVPVTRLVVLSATPTKVTDNLFRSEDLTDQLRGRLGTLLAAAEQQGMSWLIDPALFDEVVDMANGYQVQAEESPVAGAGQALAAAWLERFERLDQRAGARSLFAGPDLTGAALAADQGVVTRALSATEQVTSLNQLPLVVVPTSGVYSEAAARSLPAATAAPLLATNLVTAGALQPGPDGRLVLASAVTLGSGQLTPAATQLALAETLVAGAAGQLRVLREPEDLIADRAATAGWMTPRLLRDLLASAPATAPAEFAEVVVPTLTADQFDEVAELEHDFATYTRLAPESTVMEQAAAVLSRAVSTAWIADPAGHDDLLAALDELVGASAMRRAVSLDASSRFVMSARSNQFPLTVTNHLTEPIRVKVVGDTDNPQRLTIPETPVISIPAGESASVTIAPQASSNGVAVARVWAATEDETEIGTDITVTVEMTELGFIGWVIVITSGAVVVAATAFRLWQVRRKAGVTPAADAGPEPAPVAPVAPVAAAEHTDG